MNAPGTPARAGGWQTLLDGLADPAWIVDAGDMGLRVVNAAARALLGMDEAALRRAAADTLLATPEDLAFWDQVRKGESGELNSQTLWVDPAGRQLPVTRRIRRLAVAGNAQYLVTVQDRSEVEREASARDAALAELQATLESTADGILVTDPGGRIRVFNRRFAQIWGLPEQLLTERNDDAVWDWMRRSVVDPQGYEQRLAAIDRAALSQATEHITLHTGQVLERVTRPQLCAGRPVGRVWAFRDRTELVTAGKRIEVLSTTDALTGLINRRRMGELLAQAIARASEDKQSLALLLLDLDRFKPLNDNLGHEAGDRILMIIANRLRGCLRPRDHVARTGGDQFALLLPDADVRGAESAAQRALDAVSEPSAVGALQFTITCSIGIALFPADGATAEAIMRHAETAMKRAKVGGRAGFRYHRPQHESDLRRRLQLDQAMRQALASQRLRLKYQPQVDLASGAVTGAEALIRWRDPELGDVPPGDLIAVAQDSGFIIAVADWVLAQAARQCARWLASGIVMPVAVNVPALQFQRPDFIDRVAAVLHANRLPGELLELELTEAILARDADDALAQMSKLAALGVRLAIDGFGTGYSSLAQLERFPLERLKIDRRFVAGLPGDDGSVAIVRATIALARALDLKVVAVGVETPPQQAFLRDAGCDAFQGYLFAPALDALSFVERLRERRRARPAPIALVSR